MIDPNFDPLEDLNNLMVAVTAQHQQIDILIKTINQHNLAIQNINNALRVAKNQMILMENRINEINARTANNCK